MTAVISPPAEPRRLVLTREAAKVIGCTMSHVRGLARSGKIKSWRLGPRSIAFDLDAIIKHKTEHAEAWAAAKRAGKRARGSQPKGFVADG